MIRCPWRATIVPSRPDTGRQLHDHPLAAVVGQQELLAPREDDLDRPAGRPRQGRDLRLEAELALRAEAAAEVRHDDPDPVLRQAERLGDARPHRERHLRRRPDRDVVALPLGEDRPRLDRHGVRAVGDVAARDDDIGAGHGGRGVALDDRRARGDVAVAGEVLVGLVGRPGRRGRAGHPGAWPPRGRSGPAGARSRCRSARPPARRSPAWRPRPPRSGRPPSARRRGRRASGPSGTRRSGPRGRRRP